MADVVLNVTIKDAKVAKAKQLIERFYFKGAVQTGTKIKEFLETQAVNFIKNHLIELNNKAIKLDAGNWDPTT
jgi:hypothetical protein